MKMHCCSAVMLGRCTSYEGLLMELPTVNLPTLVHRCGYKVLANANGTVTADMNGNIQLLVAGLRTHVERGGNSPAMVVLVQDQERYVLSVWPDHCQMTRWKDSFAAPKHPVGVYPRRKRYCALICLGGRQYYGGLYRTLKEAAWAHDELAMKLLAQGAKTRYHLHFNYLEKT
jgi:hypothetical protein